MSLNLSVLLQDTRQLAYEAGQLALSHFRRPATDLDLQWKADGSPVTAADAAVEAFLRQVLQARYPEHGILGEEEGLQTGRSDWLWILDPIDGTRSFARGIPIFGVQLALCFRREPVLGVIDLPALGEQIAAAEGLGCFWNGERCRVSDEDRLSHSLIHLHEQALARQQCPEIDGLLARAQLERNWGDCYSFVLAATGRAEAALDPRMQVWDSAPLPVLMREAGGVFLSWQGGSSIWDHSVACMNPAMARRLKPLFKAGSVL
ncbi:MAG: histidinol phosphate phosphatase [Candidatus Sericytochromatia bacterium]|nr:histidinol phosphate phosphatase [Candidatus Sericytochromatia bacterium]